MVEDDKEKLEMYSVSFRALKYGYTQSYLEYATVD